MKHMGRLFILLLVAVAIGPVAALAATLSPDQIADKVLPSVVLVVAIDSEGEPIGFGSGFVIGDGIVITNVHVIAGGYYVLAKLVNDDQIYEGEQLLAYNEEWDLAILSFGGLNAPAIRIGDSNSLRIGAPVYAVGNPEGLEGTFSVGNVSAKRQLEGVSYIQITSPVSPGSSGGPVLDQSGKVIAVTTSQFQVGQNLNFAVPVTYLKSLIKSSNINIAPKQAKLQNRQMSRSGQDQATKVQPADQQAILKNWFAPPKEEQATKDQPSGQQAMLQNWFNRPKEDQPHLTIVGDRITRYFYLPWCSGYEDVPEKNRVEFQSGARAKKAGFKKADSCPQIGIIK